MSSKRKPKSQPPASKTPAPEEAEPATQTEAAGTPAAEENLPTPGGADQAEPAVTSPPQDQAETIESSKDEAPESGGNPANNEVVEVGDTKESGGTPVDPSQGTDETVQASGGTPAAADTAEPEEPGAVMQRRAEAAERWAEKQGWGPTETRKLVESAPGLVDKGWLWQCQDGTREFIAAEIPADKASFKDAVAEIALSKQERYWFLWNERLQDV